MNLGMDRAFLRAYSQRLIKTCHRREVHAMGGMAAQIPIKDDAAANDAALAKVRADKLREVTEGHDGTWVAHPGLVGIAKEIFDANMPTPNQIHVLREDVRVGPQDLLRVHEGTRTDAGLRHNVRVGIQYLEAWLRGVGCVPIHHLMEDAATAEISRAQIWQWIRHPRGVLSDGRRVTRELFRQVLKEEYAKVSGVGKFGEARELLDQLATSEEFVDFLTLPAYRAIH